MLDQSPITEPCIDLALTCDWREHLRSGHIVKFRFPLNGPAEADAPKARPCLILDVRAIDGRAFASIAYGTSAYTPANQGLEVRVEGAETAISGLHRPTRFVGVRRVIAPLDDTAFVASKDTRSPVIGRLTGPAADQMRLVLARIRKHTGITGDSRAKTVANARTDWRTRPKGRVSFPLRKTRRPKPGRV